MKVEKIRRYDLDWLRVLVFGLLIIYHVGMFFVPWGWHLKNNVIYDWMVWPMRFVNQWRLPILFVISGMGTSFALAYRSAKTFAWERISRLGLPLVFGMIMIIPPQVYLERLVDKSFTGSYIDFLINGAFQGIYPIGNFSWHHLWFLPYLLIFSVVLIPVFVYARDHPKMRFLVWLRRIILKPFGLYIFVIPLYLIEIFIEPFFDETHALIGDWFAIAYYSFFFLIGYICIRCQEEFWIAINQVKAKALLIGSFAFLLQVGIWLFLEDGLVVHLVEGALKIINIWSWIYVLFGYVSRYLNHKSELLSYCNRAVYPFYILHQTVQLILCYFVMDLSINFINKFSLLTAGTFLVCWVLYEFLIRRISILKPLFGLKS